MPSGRSDVLADSDNAKVAIGESDDPPDGRETDGDYLTFSLFLATIMHPALLPARLSQLPPTSMRIAKKAMDGNLPAFMAIRRIFDQPSFNKVELWAPVLVANLAADRMPTQRELDYDSEDRLWPLALNAIACAHNSLLFFTDKGVTLITQLRADSITAKLIDTTAGVRTVVARAVKSLFPEDYDVREYWDFSNGWELLGGMAIQSTEHLDELLDGFDTSLYGLAGTVVRHLDLVTENLEADGTDPPFFYIGLVYTQIATCSLSFTACLRSCGIVSLLTDMLRIFVDLDREIINPLDELFLPLLRDNLDRPRALAHAITAGLLEVLILSVTNPFSRRDRLFMCHLARHDYTLNRETLIAKYQAANDASSDERAFCVVFDYTRGELGISVCALTSQPEEHAADASLRQRTWVRAWEKHGVNSGLVIMRVSCGDNSREHLVWTHRRGRNDIG
ncbi:hypothetical protein C8J57DRAFT_1600258 [Mycena rebaudengoi]|nr:hypothetical protein C8J57DRAFT_1600258 [Mycena rebaudengoi]